MTGSDQAKPHPQTCSRCGRPPLWLVTLRYEPGGHGGRVLTYCDKCRIEFATGVATAIPLSIANADPDGVMALLYGGGFTASEPGGAAEMLRLPSSGWVEGAERALRHPNVSVGLPEANTGGDVEAESSGPTTAAVKNWDGGLDRQDYADAFVRDRDRLADAAHHGRWGTVLRLLRGQGHGLSPNHWRLGGTSLFTPLHQAAWLGAPESVVTELIELGASRRLPTGDGRTAHDIAAAGGHERLLPLLEPTVRNPTPDHVLARLDRGLVGLIEGRIRPDLTVRVRPLPTALLTELEPGTTVWFPIPGMYGGFAVRLEMSYLEVQSWSRVVGGSGQAHVVTAEGVTLVAEGFV